MPNGGKSGISGKQLKFVDQHSRTYLVKTVKRLIHFLGSQHLANLTGIKDYEINKG